MAIGVVARAARSGGLVVLAGAGVSMAAPASLPGWLELNRMVLDALMRRLGDYTQRQAELEQLLGLLIERRDEQRVFPPEYQAQVMEEQIGLDYFRALQALDVPQRNATHEALAALAAAGYVAAIVTTNFDRLIEGALESRGVPHRVSIEPDGYRALADALASGQAGPLPVVKIHGSVEDAASLVDTLRQRLRGRGPALEAALRPLLERHHWVFCGFSGADLDFDPEYLGLRAAAGVSPGFTFLHRPSEPPRPSVGALRKAYGRKARFVATTLEEWLAALSAELGVPLPPAPPAEVADPRAAVADGLRRWADELRPMEAVNAFSALLEAGGQEPAARRLLHMTWSWFRTPDDTSGPAYSRFLLNYGRLALAAADEEHGETIQSFLRTVGELPAAAAYGALFFAYAGRRAEAVGLFREAFERADAPSTKAELALSFAAYGRVYGDLDQVLNAIAWALPAATGDGDLPRTGRLRAAAALILAQGGMLDQARAAIDEAQPIAERIGDDVLAADVALAEGALLFFQQDYDGARSRLAEAAGTFAQYGRLPRFLDAALEWIQAAYMAGDVDEAWAVYEKASSDIVAAYQPRLDLVMGRWYTATGDHESARRNLDHGAAAAARHDNEWMGKAIAGTVAQLPA